MPKININSHKAGPTERRDTLHMAAATSQHYTCLIKRLRVSDVQERARVKAQISRLGFGRMKQTKRLIICDNLKRPSSLALEETPTPTALFKSGSPQGWFNPFAFHNGGLKSPVLASPGSPAPGGLMFLTPNGGLPVLSSPELILNPFHAQGALQLSPMPASPGGALPAGMMQQYLNLSTVPNNNNMNNVQYLPMQTPWPNYPSYALSFRPPVTPKTPNQSGLINCVNSAPFQFTNATDCKITPGTVKAEEHKVQCSINDQDSSLLSKSTEVRQLLKTNHRLVDILSDHDQDLEAASETYSVTGSDISNANESSVSTQGMAKTTRVIQETDDPALSDKRRRNRIAAEKCRNRRKERQVSLEVANRDLSQQLENLNKRLAELREESRHDVQQLQLENRSLKSENKILRSQLTAVPTSHTHFLMSSQDIAHSAVKRSKFFNDHRK